MGKPVEVRMSAARQIVDRDMREYARELEAEGFTIRKLNGGHFVIERDGVHVATFGGTRTDYRAKRNVRAYVNRWKRENGLAEPRRA